MREGGKGKREETGGQGEAYHWPYLATALTPELTDGLATVFNVVLVALNEQAFFVELATGAALVTTGALEEAGALVSTGAADVTAASLVAVVAESVVAIVTESAEVVKRTSDEVATAA